MKLIRNKWRTLMLTGLLLLLASVTQAQGQGCAITTIPVDFGNYNFLLAKSQDATGAIEVTCPVGTRYDVILGPGLHPARNRPYRPRQMHHAGGKGSLDYQLYTNYGRTRIWGDGVHSYTAVCTEATCVARQTTRRVGTGQVTTRTFKVFGRVPLKQNSWAGAYSDLVTVTVRY